MALLPLMIRSLQPSPPLMIRSLDANDPIIRPTHRLDDLLHVLEPLGGRDLPLDAHHGVEGEVLANRQRAEEQVLLIHIS
jgi:hypothetical protein